MKITKENSLRSPLLANKYASCSSMGVIPGGTRGTPPKSEIICGQNVGTKVVCGKIPFFEKKAMLKI